MNGRSSIHIGVLGFASSLPCPEWPYGPSSILSAGEGGRIEDLNNIFNLEVLRLRNPGAVLLPRFAIYTAVKIHVMVFWFMTIKMEAA
jgi:hypothetical protein